MKKFLVPQTYQIEVLHVLILRINYLFVHMRNGFVVNTKKNAIVENEIVAIGLTFGLDDPRPNRRLKNFTFHNDNGKPHTVKMLEINNLFISGIILSLKKCTKKGKEQALRYEGFRQIEFYAISRYEESILVIWIFVNIADYDCVNLQMTTKAYIF